MQLPGFLVSRKRDGLLAAIVVFGILGMFVFDISAPRGEVDGVGYAALVALCMPFGRRVLFGCAILTTALIVIAHFLLPDAGISVAGELANRFFAIASIWIIAFLLSARLGLEEAIASREATLARHQEALLRIVRESLSSDRPLEDKMRVLTEIAGETLAVERTSIFVLNNDCRTYRCLDLWQRSHQRHIVMPDMPVAQSPGYFEAIRNRLVVASDDALNDPLVRHRAETLKERNIGAVLVAGIFVEGRLRGLLSLAHAEVPRRWTAEEVAFAQSLSSVLALLLLAHERARLESKLQQSAKMQALGQLAGGVAHDFNNVLGSILGFAGLLKQDLPAGSAQHGFAERVLVACERGKELIEQILAFARAGSFERRVVNLPRILRDNLALLRAALPYATRLVFAATDEDLRVLCNDVQISQLMNNLCRNANDALNGAPGSVTVTLDRALPQELKMLSAEAPGEFLIGTAEAAAAYARIRVADTGGGMPPRVLAHIFEPFFTTKSRRHGTGIGLAVVQAVVEGHGGVCHVKSTPGDGTIFSIYLPLTEEAEFAPVKREAGPEELRGVERILIVDDDADFADMLCIGFERLGYTAVGVNDPLEALAAFEEDPGAWDVVIADELMPAMRGHELMRRMKAIRPGLAAVICTGFSDGASEEVSQDAGADAFFRKPVDAGGIAPRLRALLDNGR